MSGHGANPVFFNKKIKIGRSEHSLTPLRPITSDCNSYIKTGLYDNVDRLSQ